MAKALNILILYSVLLNTKSIDFGWLFDRTIDNPFCFILAAAEFYLSIPVKLLGSCSYYYSHSFTIQIR